MKSKTLEIPLFRIDGSFFARINYPEDQELPDAILAGNTNKVFLKIETVSGYQYQEKTLHRPEAAYLSFTDPEMNKRFGIGTPIEGTMECTDCKSMPDPLPEIELPGNPVSMPLREIIK